MISVVTTSLVETFGEAVVLLFLLFDEVMVADEEAALVVEGVADVWTELETEEVCMLEDALEAALEVEGVADVWTELETEEVLMMLEGALDVDETVELSTVLETADVWELETEVVDVFLLLLRCLLEEKVEEV